MFQFKKIPLAVVSLSLGVLLTSQIASAAETYNNKKTTTVEQTTTQTSTTTAPRATPRAAPKVVPVTTTSNTTTTLTTKEGELRKVLDEDALKDLAKLDNGLCAEGFKSSVGNDNKNICQGKGVAPDIAYSCIWKEEGNAAYAPTPQGPCTLDYAEHKGSIIVTKNDYKSFPPLPYGSEAQCCFRAAKGPATSSVEVSPTTTTVTPTPTK